MKVLYLIDTLEGYGAEKSIVQIALHMTEVTPVFVNLYKGDKLKPFLINKGITVYSLNIPKVYGYKKAIKQLLPIIEKESPDIIHSTLFRAEMISRKIKKLYPEKILIGSFVSNSYGKQRYAHLSFLSKMKLFSTQLKDKITANHVDYFICNSKAIKTTNVKALGISEEKIKVIYRGRSFSDFRFDLLNVEDLKQEWGLESKKVFLHVGRLIKSKGQLDLLYSFRQLVQNYPDAVLIMAGEGPLSQLILDKIKRLKLEEHIFLIGYREDIPELLKLSDYFVFPSYFEGLPGALIEAIISRKPAIVSDIPENRECFSNGGALFFTPGNKQELLEKMEEAIKFNGWERRVEKSFAHAEKNFDIQKISREYENFYKFVLEQKCLNKV